MIFFLGVVAGLMLRHWLDLHEIPRREPKVLRDAQEEVDKAWGASEVTYRREP